MKTERKILEADEFKQEERVCDGRDLAEGGKQNESGWEKHLEICCLVIWLKTIRIWRQIFHKSRQFWSKRNESLSKNLSTTCWMAP